MTGKKPLLFSRAELADLAPRLLTWAGESHEGEDGGTFDHGLQCLVEAFAASAVLARDADQVPTLVSLCQCHWRWNDDLAGQCLSAAMTLAGDAPGTRALVCALAADRELHVGFELSGWLDPAIAAERALLESYLDGRAGEFVARRARERLSGALDVPWWQGKFAQDPAAGLEGPGTRESLAALVRFGELMESSDERTARDETLLAIARGLPPRAALLCLQAVLERAGWGVPGPAPFLALALAAEDGAAFVADRLEKADEERSTRIRRALPEAAASAPPSAVAALARELLRRAEDRPWSEVADWRSRASRLVDACLGLWPAQADPAPLLDCMLRWGEGLAEPAAGTGLFSAALRRAGAGRPALADAFARACEADWLGRWAIAGPALAGASELWPELRRELARERLALSNRTEVLDWAARVAVDDDEATALRHMDDPRVRPSLFGNLRGGVFLRARRELRAGRLTLREAAAVFRTLEDQFGGVVRSVPEYRRPQDDEEPAPAQRPPDERQAFLGRLGDAGDLAGPPLPAEWDELRRLRSAAGLAGLDWPFAALPMPPGAWHPDDLAWARNLVQSCVDGDFRLPEFVAHVLSCKPFPESLALCERLRGLGDEEHVTGSIEGSLRELRRRLGLAPEPPDGPEPAAGPATGDEQAW